MTTRNKKKAKGTGFGGANGALRRYVRKLRDDRRGKLKLAP